VLDACIVAVAVCPGVTCVSHRPRDRVAAATATQQAAQQELVVGVGVAERIASVVAEALLDSLEQVAFDDGGSRNDDPFVRWSDPLRTLAVATIHSGLRWVFRLHGHDAIHAELSDIRSIAEH
jgi:hypothetical protein